MNKTCPLKCTTHYANIECSDKCVLFDDGCLIKQSLKTYINSHKPVQAYTTAPKTYSIPAYDSDDMTGLVLCP